MKVYFKCIDVIFGTVVFLSFLYCAGICESLDLDLISSSDVLSARTLTVIGITILTYIIEFSKAYTWAAFMTLYLSIFTFIAMHSEELTPDQKVVKKYRQQFDSSIEYIKVAYSALLSSSQDELEF